MNNAQSFFEMSAPDNKIPYWNGNLILLNDSSHIKIQNMKTWRSEENITLQEF